MLSTGTPYGLMAMKRVCEPVAMPDRFTCSAPAPGGTVTKYDRKLFRSTEPSAEKEYAGADTGFEATTTVATSKSTTLVAGSSTVMMAPCAPAVIGLAFTLTVTVLFSGSQTTLGAE